MAIKSYGTKEKKGLKYEVVEKLGVLDSDSKMPKELRVISWNGGTPKYDIRGWGIDENGNETMTKGLTFDAEELQNLYDILTEMNEED